jgi:type IV pilus assembly protein PilP
MTMRIRVLVVATSVILAACGGDEHQDIKEWMADSAKDLHGRIQPIPEIKPFPVVSYDAGDLLDPFDPRKAQPEKRGSGGSLQPDFDRPREPLEAFPLESLKMVGVVRIKNAFHGLVDASGVVHQVKSGNHIGLDFGVITGITESEVRIKELVQDPSGQTADWVERPASLQLQESVVQQKESRK